VSRHVCLAPYSYFDAARFYGQAEAFLADCWRNGRSTPDAIVLGSKWGYTTRPTGKVTAKKHEVKDHSVATLRRQLAESGRLWVPSSISTRFIPRHSKAVCWRTGRCSKSCPSRSPHHRGRAAAPSDSATFIGSLETGRGQRLGPQPAPDRRVLRVWMGGLPWRAGGVGPPPPDSLVPPPASRDAGPVPVFKATLTLGGGPAVPRARARAPGSSRTGTRTRPRRGQARGGRRAGQGGVEPRQVDRNRDRGS